MNLSDAVKLATDELDELTGAIDFLASDRS